MAQSTAQKGRRMRSSSSSSSAHQFFIKIPSTFSIIFLPLFLILCIFASEQSGVTAEQTIGELKSPFQSWLLNREVRSPKPKFIRFGRGIGGQKFIRFGKRNSPEYDGAENLDELINVVEDLYPARKQLRQLAFLTAPKRAQKFIRFG